MKDEIMDDLKNITDANKMLDMKNYNLYRKLMVKYNKDYRFRYQTRAGCKAENTAPLHEIMYLIKEHWIKNVEIIEEV